MKTKIISATVAFLFALPIIAQDRTTVNAMSSEISDNLDLRAIASIFGDSKNLEDFENRLNDPKIQISNLDLNDDNKVDYLRVIESVEEKTHLVVVQAVLGRDTYQDVATIEVEKDSNNQVQVQVVGDVYMYGQNYIYEPVYVATPVIYSSFWVPKYRPYCSVWYWDYYPTYYYAWNPCPVFRYRNHIGIHINFGNRYDYATTRRCHRAVVMHQPIRSNYCERNYPTRSFAYRNNNYSNRYELDRTRNIRTVGAKNDLAYSNTLGNGRNNTEPIKQITRSESNTIGRTTEANPIRTIRTPENATTGRTGNESSIIGRSNESNPIKISRNPESASNGRTRTETNAIERSTESNPKIKTNSGTNGRENTHFENTRSNAGVKSPMTTNNNSIRERVSTASSRSESSNNNGREINASRGSNERASRR